MKKNSLKFYLLIFIIGSIIGWGYELIFYLLTEQKLINSGFLYGPYLPVYGYGSVLIVTCLKRLKKHPLVLFLLAMILTGVLEYITGAIMWEIWHQRWWNYTGLLLNIDGYVCLRSVLSFAIGAIILIYWLEPKLNSLIKDRNNQKIDVICTCFLVLFIIDNIITLIYRHPIL